jgi:hypothetical protein
MTRGPSFGRADVAGSGGKPHLHPEGAIDLKKTKPAFGVPRRRLISV